MGRFDPVGGDVETGDHTEWLRRPTDAFFEHVQLSPPTDADAAQMQRLRAEELAAPLDRLLHDLAEDIVAITDRNAGLAAGGIGNNLDTLSTTVTDNGITATLTGTIGCP